MHNMEPFHKVLRILIEQDADLVILKFKRQMLGLHFDEQILATNSRYIHYWRNKKCIIIKDDFLYGQYDTDFGDISQL